MSNKSSLYTIIDEINSKQREKSNPFLLHLPLNIPVGVEFIFNHISFRILTMHRSFPNVVPVANKYLGHKTFLKTQADHENNIKNARTVLDRSEPPPRPHCTQRLRQKKIREHELEMIEQENERLRIRMMKNGSFINTHNNYATHSLNTEKRQRDQARHENEFQRLQKQIGQVRPSYPEIGRAHV